MADSVIIESSCDQVRDELDTIKLDSTPCFSSDIDSHVPCSIVLDGETFSRPCDVGTCSSRHMLDGVPIQLNPCSFFEECFCHPAGIDENASYIFKGVRDGFDIIDKDFEGSYFCSNYQSILDSEFRTQMDRSIQEELDSGKVSLVSEQPKCVNSLGAIRKRSGKLRPITVVADQRVRVSITL